MGKKIERISVSVKKFTILSDDKSIDLELGTPDPKNTTKTKNKQGYFCRICRRTPLQIISTTSLDFYTLSPTKMPGEITRQDYTLEPSKRQNLLSLCGNCKNPINN